MYFSEHKWWCRNWRKRTCRQKSRQRKQKTNKNRKTFWLQIFFRINLDAENFDIFFEISKIQGYIAQSNKEKLEKEKEAEITELKENIKKLEAQIKEPKKKKDLKNSAINQITNNFGKVTIKNWWCKTWKTHNQK